MRVGSLQMTTKYMTQLNRTYDKQTKLMEQSDGAMLHRPSDNPIGYSKYLRFSTSYGENDQYQYNVKTAVSWMKNTDSALIDMSDSMKTVVEKTNQAQGTNTDSDMKAIAAEMFVQVQQCVADANTQVNGRYLFAGQADLIQPYLMSEKKFERGLAKTLDDKQAAFFNTATQSDDITQMLTLEGDDGNIYYLNTKSGDIYTKEFVDEGYKDFVSNGCDSLSEYYKDSSKYPGLSDPKFGSLGALKVSDHFDSRGVIKNETDKGKNFSATVGGVTMTFVTIEQYIVTYQGDKKQFSMVKENGAAQPATDTVNAGGVQIAGCSIFDNEDSGNEVSGANTFNDLLTVVAMCERGEKEGSRWMSSDGKTLANNSFNTVNIAQTVVAARQQIYTDCEDMLTTQSETILEDITTVHSTDVAKLAVEMMTAQTIYNLSLSVGSRVIPPTLADYL
ncbi:MAG: flagellar hook protein [Schwartzia sp.]|nr:flagellar hook protein [Schwartzia sp. (in: firmicutes)]